MTDKEKYQRTFAVLHASEFDLEENAMNKRKGIRISKKVITVCAAAAIAAAMSVGAYAADIGNIQRKVQVWLPLVKNLSSSMGEKRWVLSYSATHSPLRLKT